MVWIVEGIIIIGLPLYIELTKKIEPFCEDCVRWIEEKKTASFFDKIINVEELKSQLEDGNFCFINSLGKTSPEASKYSQIQLLKCTQCDEKFYLNINNIIIIINSKGIMKTKVISLINNLVIDATTYSRLEKFIFPKEN